MDTDPQGPVREPAGGPRPSAWTNGRLVWVGAALVLGLVGVALRSKTPVSDGLGSGTKPPPPVLQTPVPVQVLPAQTPAGAPVPAVPAAAVVSASPTKTEAPNADVMVDAMGGPAQVWVQGRVVGQTPYRARLPVGSQVALELRREGANPTPVQFEVRATENRYDILLQRAP